MDDPYYNENVPAHVAPGQIFDFNIYDPEYQDLDLFHSIKRLQDIGLPDLFWTRKNGGHWIALRGAIIAEIFRDAANFSSRRPFVPDEQNFETSFFIPLMADPPQHATYRKVAGAAFSPQRILGYQDEIRTLTASIIEKLAPQGQCEFMRDFSLQMPVIVILKQLDLPLEHRPRLLEIADNIVRPPPKGELRDDALQQVFDYLTPILEQRRRSPGTDVLSAITQGIVDGRPITEEDARHGIDSIDRRSRLRGGDPRVFHPLSCRIAGTATGDNQRPCALPRCDGRTAAALPGDYARPCLDQGHGFSWGSNETRRARTLGGSHDNFDDRLFANSLEVDFGRKREGHLTFRAGTAFLHGFDARET